MTVWQALLVGAVQGLTEFLPISSSGHMLLVRRLLGFEAGMLFDVMMHVGTLLAGIVVFRRDDVCAFRKPKRLALIALATIPAGLAGVLLSGVIERTFGGGEWLFVTFAASGLLIIATRAIVKRREARGVEAREVGAAQAAAMGIAQAAALLPGLSRSGTTIFAGIAAGGKREDVAAFAFIMSIPVVAGSAVLGAAGGLHGGVGLLPTLVGCASAFITGVASARLALRTVGKAASVPMAVYLFAAALLSLVLWSA